MNILAIDTSTDYLSLAILKDGRPAAKFHKKAHRKHSMLLVPAIERLLKKAKLNIGRIDCFAVSIGPGSFTGLRIGVTVVKGFAYALKRPIVAVPTLDAIADNAKGFKGVICPSLDARKNKVYSCIYKSDGKSLKRLSKYLLLPAADLLKKVKAMGYNVLFLGDAIPGPGLEIFRSWHPKAEVVARLGAEYFRKRKFVKAEDLEPMYIYSKECDITGI
jgi:tRNA threonylcarbamoyladenosine biosynthesis protein TsaB